MARQVSDHHAILPEALQALQADGRAARVTADEVEVCRVWCQLDDLAVQVMVLLQVCLWQREACWQQPTSSLLWHALDLALQ